MSRQEFLGLNSHIKQGIAKGKISAKYKEGGKESGADSSRLAGDSGATGSSGSPLDAVEKVRRTSGGGLLDLGSKQLPSHLEARHRPAAKAQHVHTAEMPKTMALLLFRNGDRLHA